MRKEWQKIGLEDVPNIYFSQTRYSRCPMIRVSLVEEISPSLLMCALKKTMKRYPILNFKVVEDETDYRFAWNDRAAELKHIPLDGDKQLGQESCDFPWLLSYYENSFVLTFSHAIFDGVGAFEVIKTLLYYYAEAQGIDLPSGEGIKTLADDMEKLLDEEMELALENYHDNTVEPFPEKPLRPADAIPPHRRMSPDEISSCHRIVIDVNTLTPALKRYETTPFAILVPILARALRPLYDVENPVIQTHTAINCRPIIGAKTLRNFIELATIDYIPEQMDSFSAERIPTIFRSILDVKLHRDNLVSTITAHYEGAAMLEQLPMEERIAMMEQGAATQLNAAFIFSYTGRIHLPKALESMVSHFEVAAEASFAPLTVEAIGYRDTLTLLIANRLKDTSYLDRIEEALHSLSIACTIEEAGRLPTCIFTP